jgi:hypothetical protein
MDYSTARKLLKTEIAKTFCRTKFRNAELRRRSLIWATKLPSGSDINNQIETLYHTNYKGAEIRFGKPGKESKRKRSNNRFDMTPLLYEINKGQLARTRKGFEFEDVWNDLALKIDHDAEAGHVLLAMLYRAGVLDDHSFLNNKFSYNPNPEIMAWLDQQFNGVGETPPSELIPLFDAILLNEDIKLYTNVEKYDSSNLQPFEPRGRINTMGAVFVICAPEALLSRIKACSLLIRGRGTPAIFSSIYHYGADLISPMTNNIITLNE